MSTPARSSPERVDRTPLRALESPVELARVGDEFVVLRALDDARCDLEAWLADRPEVKEIVHRGDELHVRFADAERTPGAFVRSLRDRVFAVTAVPSPALRARIVHLLEGRVRLQVDGLDDSEFLRLAEHVRGLSGVVRATASPASGSLLVSFDPVATTARAILDVVAKGDRDAWPPATPAPRRWSLGQAAFNTVVLAAATTGALPALPMGAAVALTALPSLRRTLASFEEKRVSVDLLDVVAIAMSIGTGAPTTGAFITWLLGVGDVILEQTADSARNAIAKLVRLEATEAWVVRGHKVVQTAAKSLRVGDVLVVGPGRAVAADGVVVLGAGLDAATSVLITDFGTGIRVSVPTATLAAITVAAREGLLIKAAQYLERLSKVDVIVFDKTGTLTTGTPRVFDVRPLHGSTVESVIRFAGAAEARQKHPVAQAIRAFAAREGIAVREEEIHSAIYTAGMGVRARLDGHEIVVGGVRFLRSLGVSVAQVAPVLEAHEAMGGSSVLTVVDHAIVGVIGIADEPRAETRGVVEALKASGRRQILLMSGDGRVPVERVARAAGADRAYSELLPEKKASLVRRMQAEGHVVAMVGDGINDAPALALADVGISLEGGTDVALETADVVLLEGGLAKLPHAFEVADDAMKTVRRALDIVIAPNALAIALAALGLLPPSLAVVVNNGSTVAAALAGVAPLFTRRRR